MVRAHWVKDRNVPNGWEGAVRRATGGFPRPPTRLPSWRSMARAWRTGPREVPNSAQSCDSGAEVTTEATLPDNSADGTAVEICRNDVCDNLVKVCRDPLCVPDFSSGFTGSLPAAMADGSLGGNSWGFRVAVRDDPAVLSDGDRYRLNVADRNGNMIASVDKTVVYQQSYPNGTQCDPFPCRWAEIVP